jgi:hypothetical protein
MAAKQHKQEMQQVQTVQAPATFDISDCDLGASPVMTKTSFLPKQAPPQQAKMCSPLQLAVIFSLNKKN